MPLAFFVKCLESSRIFCRGMVRIMVDRRRRKSSIQIAPIEVKLVKRGRVFVMVPTKPITTKITTDEVNAVRDALRKRRIR